MEIEIMEMRMVPGDPDLSCGMGDSGDFAGTVVDRELVLSKVVKGLKFYYPVHPEFRGNFDELKSITCPGEGYIAERPWCTFNTEYNYELKMFLDLYPYTVFNKKK